MKNPCRNFTGRVLFVLEFNYCRLIPASRILRYGCVSGIKPEPLSLGSLRAFFQESGGLWVLSAHESTAPQAKRKAGDDNRDGV